MNAHSEELTAEELLNVLAGNSQGMSEATALEHPELFRESQIEHLKESNEELSAEDLLNVLAGNSQGMSEATALEHPELFREGQIEQLEEETAGIRRGR